MQTIGYIAEYYVDNVFIGYLPFNYNGEEVCFRGRMYIIADSDIKIKKKKIYKGTKYSRIIYPIQGSSNIKFELITEAKKMLITGK
jgi:hypothetical protein